MQHHHLIISNTVTSAWWESARGQHLLVRETLLLGNNVDTTGIISGKSKPEGASVASAASQLILCPLNSNLYH